MRLGWGRDDGPFFLLVPGTQAARALRAGAHSTLHGVVFAILCLGSAVYRRSTGWVERSDTHQFEFTEMMGFAKGSTHPTSRAIAPCGSASSRAQAKSRDPAATKQPDGQITQNLSSPPRKNISLSPS